MCRKMRAYIGRKRDRLLFRCNVERSCVRSAFQGRKTCSNRSGRSMIRQAHHDRLDLPLVLSELKAGLSSNRWENSDASPGARTTHRTELSEFMQWLLTSHVRRYYHKHYGTSGHIWQGRFKSVPVQRDEHLVTVLSYVLQNTIRAACRARCESGYGRVYGDHN